MRKLRKMGTENKTIEHARLGLTNTQNTIAFVDKKIAMGISVISVILGFVYPRGMVGSAIVKVCRNAYLIDWFSVVFLLILLFTVITVGFSLYHAYKTIFPRPPARKGSWVLFPFAVKDDDALFTAIDNKFAGSGMTEREILNEFRDQLSILGYIQAKKMSHCKATFQWLGWFSLALSILAVMAFFK